MTETTPDTEPDEGRMTFMEHLRELRDRMRNAILALIIGVAIAGYFATDIYEVLRFPLWDAWSRNAILQGGDPNQTMYFSSLTGPFLTYFSIALWAGIFVSSPFSFYQLWLFVAPGLYKKEKLYGIAFAFISAICFVGGALFCYHVVLPVVCDYLLGYQTGDIKPLLDLREYLDFVRKLLLGFGVAFELPLLMLILSLLGVVTHRGLWKFNRWWVLLSFIISAILTPPDVVSQLLMAGPLVLLYNLSIIIALVVTKRKERAAQKA